MGSRPAVEITKKCALDSQSQGIKFAHGRRFSPGTPASSTTKTGRHDIAEILLKVALNTNNQLNQLCIKETGASLNTSSRVRKLQHSSAYEISFFLFFYSYLCLINIK